MTVLFLYTVLYCIMVPQPITDGKQKSFDLNARIIANVLDRFAEEVFQTEKDIPCNCDVLKMLSWDIYQV